MRVQALNAGRLKKKFGAFFQYLMCKIFDAVLCLNAHQYGAFIVIIHDEMKLEGQLLISAIKDTTSIANNTFYLHSLFRVF